MVLLNTEFVPCKHIWGWRLRLPCPTVPKGSSLRNCVKPLKLNCFSPHCPGDSVLLVSLRFPSWRTADQQLLNHVLCNNAFRARTLASSHTFTTILLFLDRFLGRPATDREASYTPPISWFSLFCAQTKTLAHMGHYICKSSFTGFICRTTENIHCRANPVSTAVLPRAVWFQS